MFSHLLHRFNPQVPTASDADSQKKKYAYEVSVCLHSCVWACLRALMCFDVSMHVGRGMSSLSLENKHC